ncbi:glycosyl hydrolase family 18 protein [Vibrio aestuarianus]|uniref:chitinase n=1 Tax=Vibrio aestuarianus TaxID=28171 RepID=A0ABD7YQY1_9VIBR|nr:glycosyl hydrolase family 18 protein [Vibrio aestuarianus]WGK87041.1 glycosyl hydrolase family 18 protein [Vibrio aestuarianus]CAH8237547.1 Chitinase [Vibrio aestuarianus]
MKLQKTQLSILVGLTLMTGLASAATFDRADVRYLSPSEFAQRQPEDPQQEAFGPLNFDSEQVYNQYNPDASLPKVEAYMSNWGQYGRKWSARELANVYDTVVFSFLAMCGTEIGDPDITSAVQSLKKYTCNTDINPRAKKYEVMITDMWGDLAAAIPNMVEMISYPENSDFPLLTRKWYEGQSAVDHGALGALKKLKQQSPNTKMAFSVGGWSLSHLFSEMASDPAARQVFINSIVTIFNNYPMFSQVDIDWEYPGIKTGNNISSVNDKDNYKLLIRELRSALNAVGKNGVKIAVAAGAPQEKLDASDLKGLIDEGVDIIHLMTYDFFGSWHTWGLAHHTNLFDYEGSEWSIDKSVTYMIEELKIDPKNIFIGYANYSRNATNARISSQSPLQGDHLDPYDTTGKYVGGSWEKGVYEWYDIEQEFLSINPNSGLSVDKARHAGYQLLTDKEANADYIYSNEGEFFMSFDTPRSVYAKAKYVKEKGLGGIFNWMADYDTGYLVNSAREGLGYTKQSGIDMTQIIYSCGENVTNQQECEDLTNLTGGEEPGITLQANAGPDISAALIAGNTYEINGSASTGESITYKWTKKSKQITGIAPTKVKLNQTTSSRLQVTITDLEEAESTVRIPLKLTVTDINGDTSTDSVVLKLQNVGDNHPPVAIASANKDHVNHGELFKLLGKDSYDEDENDTPRYQWTQVNGAEVTLPYKGRRKNLTIDTTELTNKDDQLQFQLTVNDGLESDTSDIVTVEVEGSAPDNVAPNANFTVSGQLEIGQVIQLNGSSSTDDKGISRYQWVVKDSANQSVSVNGADAPHGSFVPANVGNYTVKLTVWDEENLSDHKQQTVNVTESETGGDYDYEFPAGFGSYAAGTVVKFPQGVYECFGDWAAYCNNEAFLPGVAADPNWITQQWRFLRSE